MYEWRYLDEKHGEPGEFNRSSEPMSWELWRTASQGKGLDRER